MINRRKTKQCPGTLVVADYLEMFTKHFGISFVSFLNKFYFIKIQPDSPLCISAA